MRNDIDNANDNDVVINLCWIYLCYLNYIYHWLLLLIT